MNIPAFACSVALLLLGARDTDCDLAKVESAFHCQSCAVVLTQVDLVSDVTYYGCDSCGVISAKAGKCEDCDEAMSERVSDKNVCGVCFETPDAVEVCVKTYFECPDCGDRAAAAGSCEECATALEKKVSKALVEYECAGCGAFSRQAMKCDDEECEAKGKPYTKHCSESGEFPHVGKKS